LVANNEAGNLEDRHKAESVEDPFRWDLATISLMQERQARKVNADSLGKLKYSVG
jgi:hypothetical protein